MITQICFSISLSPQPLEAMVSHICRGFLESFPLDKGTHSWIIWLKILVQFILSRGFLLNISISFPYLFLWTCASLQGKRCCQTIIGPKASSTPWLLVLRKPLWSQAKRQHLIFIGWFEQFYLSSNINGSRPFFFNLTTQDVSALTTSTSPQSS